MLSVRVIVSRTPADEQAVADYLFGRQGKYFAESAVHTEWYGSLARRWGLYLNPVDEVDFRMLLEGVHPRLGLALARGPGGKHCPGTDLTFSAPKSVSVLLALGCEEVRAAHRHAVREALAFVEAYCIRYRLKRGGRVLWRQSRAALFAVFEHETSRAGDPQLHSHAILLNVTYDKEYGKYRALRNDEIYRAQLAAGLVYRAALAEALRGYGFGIRITDPGKGLFEVAGVPDAAVEALSTRRAEIRELVERWRAEGRYGAASEAELHELACLKSRRPKERDRLDRAAVESVLEALGYDREGVLAATAHEAGDLPPDLPAREVLRAALARLGEHASFWTPAETFREVLRLGLGRLTVRDVEAALAEALREGEVLCLTPGDPASGTVLLTTPDLLEAEREFARLVEAGRDSVRPLLPDPPPPPAGLGRDQVEAYRFVLSAPHRVGGVVGMAGTGKSVLLEALVGALREAGYTVAAVAPTGRAADELRRLGVDADTVDAFLLRHGVHVGPAGDSGVRPPDPPLVAEGPDVLLVDESSMLGAVKAAALLKAFPGSRVVLVGDPRQLRPVEAGSPFENVVRAGILPHARLTRIIRQTDPAYREAVYAAARDPAEALKVLEGLGAVRQAEGLADVAEAVWEHGGPGEAVAVTPLREQAKALNGLIRAEAVRRGLVSGEGQTFEVWERLDSPLVREGDLLLAPRARRPMEVLDRRAGFIVRTSDGAEWDLRRLSGWQAYRVRTLELAPGDRIVFTRNDRRLGVRNGQVATVRAVSQDRVVVDLDRQDRVLTFNPHEFQYFDYAYALTTHKAQGISVNTIICDLPASWADARQFYVQVSRGRRRVVLCTDDPEGLAARLGAGEAERLARRAVEAGALLPARVEALADRGQLFQDVGEAVAAVGARAVWTPDPEAAEGLRKRLPASVRVETDARRLGARRYVAYLPACADLRDRRVVRGLLRARAVVADDPDALRRAVAALPAPNMDAWEGLRFRVGAYEHAYAYAPGRGPGDWPAGRGEFVFFREYRQRRVPVRWERIEDLDRLLIEAVRRGDADGVRGALRRGADPDAGAVLCVAVFRGDSTIAEALLGAGADPNRVDGTGSAPIHYAVWKGDAGLVRVLLQAGADPGLKDADGNDAFALAAYRGFAFLAGVLEGRPAVLPAGDPVRRQVERFFDALRAERYVVTAILPTDEGPVEAARWEGDAETLLGRLSEMRKYNEAGAILQVRPADETDLIVLEASKPPKPRPGLRVEAVVEVCNRYQVWVRPAGVLPFARVGRDLLMAAVRHILRSAGLKAEAVSAQAVGFMVGFVRPDLPGRPAVRMVAPEPPEVAPGRAEVAGRPG